MVSVCKKALVTISACSFLSPIFTHLILSANHWTWSGLSRRNDFCLLSLNWLRFCWWQKVTGLNWALRDSIRRLFWRTKSCLSDHSQWSLVFEVFWLPSNLRDVHSKFRFGDIVISLSQWKILKRWILVLPWGWGLITMIVSFLILRIWWSFIFKGTIFPLENFLIAGWATTNTFSLRSVPSLIIWSPTFVSIRVKYWRLSGDWCCFTRGNEGLRILLEQLLSRWERIALMIITFIMLSILLVFRIACGVVISSHIMSSWATTLLMICRRRVIFMVFWSLILI